MQSYTLKCVAELLWIHSLHLSHTSDKCNKLGSENTSDMKMLRAMLIDLFSVIAVTGNINMLWGNVQWFYQRNSIFPVYVTKKYMIFFCCPTVVVIGKERCLSIHIVLNIAFNIEPFKCINIMWNWYVYTSSVLCHHCYNDSDKATLGQIAGSSLCRMVNIPNSNHTTNQRYFAYS